VQIKKGSHRKSDVSVCFLFCGGTCPAAIEVGFVGVFWGYLFSSFYNFFLISLLDKQKGTQKTFFLKGLSFHTAFLQLHHSMPLKSDVSD